MIDIWYETMYCSVFVFVANRYKIDTIEGLNKNAFEQYPWANKWVISNSQEIVK